MVRCSSMLQDAGEDRTSKLSGCDNWLPLRHSCRFSLHSTQAIKKSYTTLEVRATTISKLDDLVFTLPAYSK